MSENKTLRMPPKNAAFFVAVFFKITTHFRAGMINGGDISMLQQVTKKEGVVGRLLCGA